MRISDWSSDVCSSDLRGAEILELVDILRIGEDRGGEALRLFAARLRGAVEHRFDLLVLEQAGVHCVGDRKAMFFEGRGGGFDAFPRLRRSSTHSCLLCWWVFVDQDASGSEPGRERGCMEVLIWEGGV